MVPFLRNLVVPFYLTMTLITRADNFVNNNFFKLARIADSLEGSNFELLGKTNNPIEDSSVKIAGSNIDHH